MTAALTLLFFLAPGASCFADGRWSRGLTLLLLNLAGLLAAVVAVTRFDLFPPATLLLWLVYQSVLTVTFRRGVPRRKPGQQRFQRLWLVAAALCFTPPLIAGYMVADATAIMRVESFRSGPVLRKGDWVSYRSRVTTSALRPGDLVVARCSGAPGNQIARVMGIPGEEVWRERGRLCTTDGCYPVKRIGDFRSQADSGAAAVEVINERYHVIIHPGGSSPAPAGMALWLGKGEFALLTDNRAGEDGPPCRDGFVAQQDDILGIPTWVLFSPELQRIGLAVK